MDQIVEQWRPVLGYEHGYEVSDQGGVRSLYRNGRHLKPSNCRGYKQVVLYAQDGLTTKGHTVHRLVAAAFILNPKNLPWVNHVNGQKDDNRVSNLEWCDRTGNVRHAVKAGLIKPLKGEANGASKFTDRERRVICRLGEIGFSQKAIAEMFETNQGGISRIQLTAAR
jgi:hypothetical protein